jgi:hypothetical protein
MARILVRRSSPNSVTAYQRIRKASLADGATLREAMVLRIACLLIVWLSVLPFAQAQDATSAVEPRELVVGVKDAAPFALKGADGTWSGLSIELWRQVAKAQKLHYRFVEAKDMPDLIAQTAAEKFDVAVGAITVTVDREQILDFTQAYYTTGTGIAVPVVSMNWGTLRRAMTSFNFLQAVVALIGLTLGAGILVWLLERRQERVFWRHHQRHQLQRVVVDAGDDAAFVSRGLKPFLAGSSRRSGWLCR